jgi:uncharacterized protein (TIGR02246 family)
MQAGLMGVSHWARRVALGLVAIGILAEAGLASGLQRVRAAEGTDPTTAIQQASAAYVKAFNTSDYVALADQWTERATLVEGSLDLEGRAAIIASLRSWRERHPAAVMEIEVTGVEMLAEPLARVSGVVKFTPQPGGRQVRSRFTSLRVREGDTWRLAESVVVPEHSTALDDLAWILGTWTAETARGKDGSRTTIETIYEQPLGPYCIVGRTRIRPANGDPIEALEVIHADRGTGLVRCWVFDSTGAFGEGVVESAGTPLRKRFVGAPADRAGGRVARWTQLLTPAGDNRCTMQTLERSIDDVAVGDGELLHFRKVR